MSYADTEALLIKYKREQNEYSNEYTTDVVKTMKLWQHLKQ